MRLEYVVDLDGMLDGFARYHGAGLKLFMHSQT